MSIPPTARRAPYDLDSVLAVAVGVFTERGYDATSMADLASAMGIGKSSIYHHVPSKEELLRLALERALGALEDVVASAQRADGRAVDRLAAVVRDTVRALVAELPFVTLLLRLRGTTELERAALQRRREFDRFVTDLVRAAAADGDLRDDIEPALATRLVFGMVNSLVEWYRPGSPPDAVVDAVVTVCFDGLRNR